MGQPQKPLDLQFINLSERATLDEEDLTKVRAHAMRDFSSKCKSLRGEAPVGEIEGDLNNVAPSSETTQEIIRFKLGPAGWTKKRKQSIYRTPLRDVPPFSTKCSVFSIGEVENDSGEEGSPAVGTHTTSTTFSHNPDTFSSENSLETLSQSKCFQNRPVVSLKGTTAHRSGTGKSREPVPRRQNEAYSRASSEQIGAKLKPQDFYQSNLGADLLDPFDTVPGLNTRRAHLLISHLNVMSVGLMRTCRSRWHFLATQDSAMLRVALSHAAGNLSMLQEQGDPTESLIWRTDAIRILNERLANATTSGLCPYTIGAVASMASYEATNGALAPVLAHMNGLDEMIRMIGGLQNISSPDLQRLILWSDLNCANALGSTPRFSARHILPLECEVVSPQDLAVGEGSPARGSVDFLESSLEGEALNESPLADLSILCPALATALLDLRYLTYTLKNIDDLKIPKCVDNLWYSDAVYSVQRRLMSLSASLPISPICRTVIIDRACNLAALIYVEIGFRNVNPHARIISNLVTTLHSALAPHISPAIPAATLYINSTLTPSMNIMFWVLMIGAAAAVDEAERVWFGAQLVQAKRMLDIGSWVEARQVLASIAWTHSVNELVRRRNIWEKMEDVMECTFVRFSK